MDGPSWQLIGTAAISTLAALVAWIGTRTLTRLGQHVQDDAKNFQELRDLMHSNHIEVLDRISGRWADRSKPS